MNGSDVNDGSGRGEGSSIDARGQAEAGGQGGRNRATRAPIDKGQVADTALDLLNDVGLEGLTLRAIAKKLNVQAPALYWHFENKQALLDEMATEMYRRMEVEIVYAPEAHWQERLRETNRALRQALLRYRDGAKVFSGSRFIGTGHGAGIEEELGFLLRAGFDLRQAVRAASVGYMYTLGFVTEEQGAMLPSGQPREGFDVEQRAVALAAYPLAAAAGPELFASYDERFDEGLDVIMAGIEARYGPG